MAPKAGEAEWGSYVAAVGGGRVCVAPWTQDVKHAKSGYRAVDKTAWGRRGHACKSSGINCCAMVRRTYPRTPCTTTGSASGMLCTSSLWLGKASVI